MFPRFLFLVSTLSCSGGSGDKDTAFGLAELPGADGYVVYEMEYLLAKNAPVPVGDSDHGWWCDTGELYSSPSTVYCLEEEPEPVLTEDSAAGTLSSWSTMSSDHLVWYRLETEDMVENYLFLDWNDSPIRCVAYVWEG